MRTRQSAAYKGIYALLMGVGAQDFLTGQTFDQTVFFDEYVDIHHVFPQKWCSGKIEPKVYNTIINKTPLSYRTNRILSGDALSRYLAQLQNGQGPTPPIDAATLGSHLRSHAIDPALLRADRLLEFMADREARLLDLISKATGHQFATFDTAEEGTDFTADEQDQFSSTDALDAEAA